MLPCMTVPHRKCVSRHVFAPLDNQLECAERTDSRDIRPAAPAPDTASLAADQSDSRSDQVMDLVGNLSFAVKAMPALWMSPYA